MLQVRKKPKNNFTKYKHKRICNHKHFLFKIYVWAIGSRFLRFCVNESSSGRSGIQNCEKAWVLPMINPATEISQTETAVSSSINRDITNTSTVHLTALCDMQMEVFLEPIKTYKCYILLRLSPLRKWLLKPFWTFLINNNVTSKSNSFNIIMNVMKTDLQSRAIYLFCFSFHLFITLRNSIKS